MDMNYNELVELITKEVSDILHQSGEVSLKPKAMIIGCMEKVPISVSSKFTLCSSDGYSGDIEKYDAVCITELSLTALCDIALGRDNTKETCAVLKALLNGKEVYLCESGLPHRKYAGKGSRALFKQYEGYTNQIISFGAVLLREQKFGTNKDCNAFADNTMDKVITEAIAKTLIQKNESIIKLRKGTVLTPSAKDIFNHSDKTVEFVE